MPTGHDTPVQLDRASRVMNPLWIISLFLGLSETTVGVAATQSSGWVQGALTVFAVFFPVIVSTAFFSVLWWRPENLYAPGDYPKHMPVSSFVEVIRKSRPVGSELLSTVIRDALESVLPSALAKPANSPEVASVVNDVVESARTELATRVISIDVSSIITESPAVEYLVRGDETIQQFLNWVWAGLTEHLAPYTYGREWLLVDAAQQRAFYSLGSSFDGPSDFRSLEEVGIKAGAKLEIRDLRGNARGVVRYHIS